MRRREEAEQGNLMIGISNESRDGKGGGDDSDGVGLKVRMEAKVTSENRVSRYQAAPASTG